MSTDKPPITEEQIERLLTLRGFVVIPDDLHQLPALVGSLREQARIVAAALHDGSAE